MSDSVFPHPRIMVIGNARHGKDSVSDLLCSMYGFTFQSSSHFVAERAVRPWLAARGITYSSFDEMYADRVNHRAAWFDAIVDFNTPDPTRLGRELFDKFTIYCGIRNKDELAALQSAGVVQFTIWVDARKRLPLEPASSISVSALDADFVIDNNGPIEYLAGQVRLAYIAAILKNKDILGLDAATLDSVLSRP